MDRINLLRLNKCGCLEGESLSSKKSEQNWVRIAKLHQNKAQDFWNSKKTRVEVGEPRDTSKLSTQPGQMVALDIPFPPAMLAGVFPVSLLI